MTFAAAICGKMKLGGIRIAQVKVEAPSLDHAIVEAHRVAQRDHSFSNGFSGYKVVVSRVEDLPDSSGPIPYAVMSKERAEFNPDRARPVRPDGWSSRERSPRRNRDNTNQCDESD